MASSDEVSDRVLKEAFDHFVRKQAISTLEKNEKFKEYKFKDFSLNNEYFNTIKVQFLALRLIAKSAKKKLRSVSDRNTYWMLTPYGETAMISLRAIQRSGTQHSNNANAAA